jgi:5'-3' exonuclease
LDEAGVVQKFGVKPESIPDYLALVGDAADGYPGLRGWGAKSSAAAVSPSCWCRNKQKTLIRLER